MLEDGIILKSEAQLFVSGAAEWTPMRKAQLEALMSVVGLGAPRASPPSCEGGSAPSAGMTPAVLLILALVGLLAGFVDAIAGGGGLVSLPALLSVGLPPMSALAVNKAQGAVGTAIAAVDLLAQGVRRAARRCCRRSSRPMSGSLCGAFTVQRVDTSQLAIAVPIALDRHRRLFPVRAETHRCRSPRPAELCRASCR